MGSLDFQKVSGPCLSNDSIKASPSGVTGCVICHNDAVLQETGYERLFILLDGYNRCPRLATVIQFKEISVYGGTESPYLVCYVISFFRQDGGDDVRAFLSGLKFGVMLHDLGFVIIKYEVSYLKGLWSLNDI